MSLSEDIRFAFRTLAKHPGFTAVAVVALALGIGANATVFAITNGVLFKNMPFVSERIMYLSTKNLSRGQNRSGVSYPDYRDWRAQTKSFETLGAFGFDVVNVSDKIGVPTRYNLGRITANTFSIIGQKPVIGRDFTAEDEKIGAEPVAILGFGIWENRYGKNPGIVGQTIKVNDVPTTVVGVMQRDLRFPIDSDFWVPYVPNADSEKRQMRDLTAFGAMFPSASETSATAELEGISHNLENEYPTTNKGIVAVVHTFSEEANGPEVWILLSALMGAVSFVLLIACANVANLLLARAVDRSREISIRIAIGAGRWRIIRQLLVESVMLSIIGGTFGWLISIWGIRAFDKSVRDRIPAWMQFSLDWHGFVFLAAISIGTGLLFGLAPALRLSKLDVNGALKDGAWGSSGGWRGKYLSGLLVVIEMALAVVLLAGAGLMIRSFVNVYQANTGVNTSNVLVMRMFLPPLRYPQAKDRIAFFQRLKQRVDSVPGVESATIADFMPTGGSSKFPYELEHAEPVDAEHRPNLSSVVISADYFRVMDVHLLRGRTFTDNDGAEGQPPVTIVNQRFAEKFWPREDPIGKRLRLFDGTTPQDWLTVVGVAPKILQNDITQKEIDPLIYLPYRQRPLPDMSLMARTHVPPGSLGDTFRREVQAVDEDMPLYALRTLEERLERNYWAQQIFASLFGIFAAIALVLASVGLYAVIAHSVNQRTQEIGVRIALGASAQTILRLVFAQGLGQLGIGLLVGLLAAAGLTRALTSLLVEVSPTDPVTLFFVALMLSISTILGCLLPALKAMRIDPIIALRHE